jgi:hypothetical protein
MQHLYVNMFDEVILSIPHLFLFACRSWAMLWSGSDTIYMFVFLGASMTTNTVIHIYLRRPLEY